MNTEPRMTGWAEREPDLKTGRHTQAGRPDRLEAVLMGAHRPTCQWCGSMTVLGEVAVTRGPSTYLVHLACKDATEKYLADSAKEEEER